MNDEEFQAALEQMTSEYIDALTTWKNACMAIMDQLRIPK